MKRHSALAEDVPHAKLHVTRQDKGLREAALMATAGTRKAALTRKRQRLKFLRATVESPDDAMTALDHVRTYGTTEINALVREAENDIWRHRDRFDLEAQHLTFDLWRHEREVAS